MGGDVRMMNVELSERWSEETRAGGEVIARCREKKMIETGRRKREKELPVSAKE